MSNERENPMRLLLAVDSPRQQTLRLTWNFPLLLAGRKQTGVQGDTVEATLHQLVPSGRSIFSIALPSLENHNIEISVEASEASGDSPTTVVWVVVDDKAKFASGQIILLSTEAVNQLSGLQPKNLHSPLGEASETGQMLDAALGSLLTSQNTTTDMDFDVAVELEPDYSIVASKKVAIEANGDIEKFVDRDVWYATNRTADGDGAYGTTFGNDISEDISYGCSKVRVPIWHRPIGALKSPLWRRLFYGEDSVRLLNTVVLSPEEYWLDIEQYYGDSSEEEHALLFLHGYNTTFNEAMLRAAQISVDLEFDGAVFAYSWPSMAQKRNYLADRDRISTSLASFRSFLVRLAKAVGPKRLHVLAHSMGNQALTGALDSLSVGHAGLSLGNILMCAPDVGATHFAAMADQVRSQSRRTTIYVSHRDHVLEVSGSLNAQQRLGFGPPYFVHDGIDTIASGHIKTDQLGHAYAFSTKEILADMHSVLASDTDAANRLGLYLHRAGYWVMRG
jgi:esterase/lipase superfamily enzyme